MFSQLAGSGAGMLAFAAYFFGALAFCVLFCLAYTRLTPHREFDLIVREHNASAAVAFGGALIGFAIALAGAIHVAGSVIEFVLWGLIAFAAQLVAYWLAAYAHPRLSDAIRRNAMAAAIWTAAASIAAGVLTAACMSP
jgi:putative membrane protein